MPNTHTQGSLTLSEIGIHFDTSSPALPTSLKFGRQNYRRMVVYMGRKHPSMLSERSRDVLRLLDEECAHIGSTDRSRGVQLLTAMQEDAESLNRELDGFKANPKLQYRRYSGGSLRVHLSNKATPSYCLRYSVIDKTYDGYRVTMIDRSITEFRLLREAKAYVAERFSRFVSEG